MRSRTCKAAFLTWIALLVGGCASTPEPAESANKCPQLAAEQAGDTKNFHAKSLLHRQFAEQFGPAGYEIGIAEERAGRVRPANQGERLAYGAVKVCEPVHGVVKCNSVFSEYAAYEERARSRMWANTRYKCIERGHG